MQGYTADTHHPSRPAHRGKHGVRATAFFAMLCVWVVLLNGCLFEDGSQSQPAQPTATATTRIEPTRPPTRPPATPTPTPYTGNPVATASPPTRADAATRYFTETGHYVGGDFLQFYRNTPNSAYLLGLPLTEEFPQRLLDGKIYFVQYFERARLERHPELPPAQRVQLGLMYPVLLYERTFDRVPAVPSTRTRLYFPETGHTLSGGFLEYWQANGGLRMFGFPISEEMGEGGLTVQYFERARFEYYKDLVGTGYAVQLSLVGYLALQITPYNVPPGTLVRINPPRLAEGHTALVEVDASPGVTVTGEYQGRPLIFKHNSSKGTAWAVLGAVPFQDTGWRAVSISVQEPGTARRTITRNLEIVTYPFPSEVLRFDPATGQLLDPAITGPERATLDAIFAGRTPDQYWEGPFRMPLDGKVRITSYFATRRCYDCPDGSQPTTYHGGMDMAAAEGTRVYAPARGKVVFSGKLEVRGNVVIIDHGMGVFTLLAHNSKLIAKVGQMVEKGEVVALSGNTGLSNGPHLHWEVHVSGPPVEPLEWVNRTMP